jgi:hypothetical protein
MGINQGIVLGRLRFSQIMQTENHSILHNLQASSCATQWSSLHGTAALSRTCPYCDSQVFNVEGLDEQQAQALITSWPHFSENSLLMRRSDGTLIVENRVCSKFDRSLCLASFVVQTLILYTAGSWLWGAFTLVGFIGLSWGLISDNRALMRLSLAGQLMPGGLSFILFCVFRAVILPMLGFPMKY